MRRRTLLLGAFPALSTAVWAKVREDSLPFPPYRIVGNVYYVGSNDITSFLITSPQGHAIINSGYEETVPIIRDSVRSLGFQLKDVRFLLNGQAHMDHIAGQPLLKALTGAKVVVSEGDARVVETGGKGDFRYEGRMSWKPCHVDRVIHDGETVMLGGTTLTARITPGHTTGCTTWTLPVDADGRRYNVVVIGGVTVLPGDRLLHNPKYPRMADDYARTFRILRSLPCDVPLGAHAGYYGMTEKYERMKKGAKSNPFIDPQGYRDFIDGSEKDFQAELARERARR